MMRYFWNNSRDQNMQPSDSNYVFDNCASPFNTDYDTHLTCTAGLGWCDPCFGEPCTCSRPRDCTVRMRCSLSSVLHDGERELDSGVRGGSESCREVDQR
jgi:hypothetical protein